MHRILIVTSVFVLAAVGYLLAQVREGSGSDPQRGVQEGPPRRPFERPPGGGESGPPGLPGLPGQQGHPGQQGPSGRPPFPPPPHPLELALDTDDDGIISAKELENAATALKKLDRNDDGQLSEREYRPRHPHGPPPGEHGPGQPPPPRPGREAD